MTSLSKTHTKAWSTVSKWFSWSSLKLFTTIEINWEVSVQKSRASYKYQWQKKRLLKTRVPKRDKHIQSTQGTRYSPTRIFFLSFKWCWCNPLLHLKQRGNTIIPDLWLLVGINHNKHENLTKYSLLFFHCLTKQILLICVWLTRTPLPHCS